MSGVMGVGAYSDLKPAWHLDKIAQLRRGEQIIPAQIQLIISDLCNHDCGFCAYRLAGYSSNANFPEVLEDGTRLNNPRRMIPLEKCKEILDDAARLGVKAIQFTGGGEPTVHPDHLEIFAHALACGMDVALVTNGSILRPGWEEIYSRFSWLRVSIDAGLSETYGAIRRVPPSTFEVVLDNVRQMADAVRRHESRCVLGTSYIVTNDNYTEIAQAARRVRHTGAPSIRYAAMFGPRLAAYYTDYIRGQAEAYINYARQFQEEDGFRVVDMFSQRMGDLAQGRPGYRFCGYQQFNVYIGADLNVYRCCNTAYNDHGFTGSLKKRRLVDFWCSDEKQRAYAGFDATGCEHCAFNGKNELINDLVQPYPAHVNFV